MPDRKKDAKKIAGGKRTTKTDVKSRVEDLKDGEPSTLMSSSHALGDQEGKRKQNGKKKTNKKVEKAREKLEKAAAKLKEDEAFYDKFIDRMHRWLLKTAPVATELFKKIDAKGDGIVSIGEFKAGLHDLNVPLRNVEVHLLTKLLDHHGTGDVNYLNLNQGLKLARERFDLHKEAEYESMLLFPTKQKFRQCPCCNLSIVEPPEEFFPRYISLELRMATFDNFREYSGHLNLLVHAHLLVSGIIRLIMEETKIASSKLAIFRDRMRRRETLLPSHKTLQECGFLGNSRHKPEEVQLYYDYTTEFSNCPILQCDHFFGQKVQA